MSSVPIPDPTPLTREELHGALNSLRELMEARLTAVDKASVLFREDMTRIPTDTDRQITQLKELHEEKMLGVDTVSKETTKFVNTLVSRLTVSAAESVLGARVEATTANDALQRLLEAAMAASTKLADVRFAAQEVAISKTETAISTAMSSAQMAIDAAASSATAALVEVNAKSIMRYESGLAAAAAAELKLGERMESLRQLIDLRARMSETAVEKANEANEKRFESVNEFRTTLSDQARDFVTVAVLDARTSQLESLISGQDRLIRDLGTSTTTAITGLGTRITQRETAEASRREAKTDDHLTIGSVMGIIGGITAVLTFIAFMVFGTVGHGSSREPPVSAVAENAKRLDDLGARLDALQRNQSAVK